MIFIVFIQNVASLSHGVGGGCVLVPRMRTPCPHPTRLMTLDSKSVFSTWKAFSLVEVLVVIAVIGVIAAIGIPLFQTVSRETNDGKDQRNAQNIAQVSSALKNLGVEHVKSEAEGGIAATAQLLQAGIVVPDGPFQGERFAVRALDNESIAGASRYLEILDRSGDLWVVYTGPDE